MMDAQRFGGIRRLYGDAPSELISRARVAVVGIGGVGSWTAEALARSGVGCLILMDADDICVTNTNRQIHALTGTYGKMKVDILAERLRAINPEAEAIPLPRFYKASQPEDLFSRTPDIVVDAIDSMRAKAHLIAECRKRGTPIVTCGGAGGRRHAESIRLADLARTTNDPMLVRLRKVLRQEYGLPLGDRCAEIGIPCVYSVEAPVYPQCDGSVGPQREPGQVGGIGCSSGFGSAAPVTGSFGFFAASAVLRIITSSSHENEPAHGARQ